MCVLRGLFPLPPDAISVPGSDEVQAAGRDNQDAPSMLAAYLAPAVGLVDEAGIQASELPRVETSLADDIALAEIDLVYHG